MHESNEKAIADRIIELCAKRLPAYYTDLDRLRDFQVLTPAKKGMLGTVNLNRQLQEVMNPPDQDKAERKYGDKLFREGDKVMQIKNDYGITWTKINTFEEGMGIFNGDVGYIREIDADEGHMIIIFDDDRFVEYEFDMLDELELAYAITVHKSQGSEFPVVIMPVSWFPPMLATRNLLYTAVTRAKDAAVLVGSADRLTQMVDNDRIVNRYSGLGSVLASLEEEAFDEEDTGPYIS